MDPETRVFQAANVEDLMILACNVIDWLTRVMDGQTELQWLRRATAVPVFVHKNGATWPLTSLGFVLGPMDAAKSCIGWGQIWIHAEFESGPIWIQARS